MADGAGYASIVGFHVGMPSCARDMAHALPRKSGWAGEWALRVADAAPRQELTAKSKRRKRKSEHFMGEMRCAHDAPKQKKMGARAPLSELTEGHERHVRFMPPACPFVARMPTEREPIIPHFGAIDESTSKHDVRRLFRTSHTSLQTQRPSLTTNATLSIESLQLKST